MPPVEPPAARQPTGGIRERKRRPNLFSEIGDGSPWKPSHWLDRLRRDLRAGGWGLAISCLTHGVLIIVLACWILNSPRRDDGDPLLIGWLRPTAAGGAAGKQKREPVRVAIDLGPGAVIETPKTVSKSGEDRGDDRVSGPPVKPVDVTKTLQHRRAANDGPAVGGSDDARQAIKRGLDWLKRVQLSDGRWELHQGYPDAGSPTIKSDTGATGLALVSLIGDGHTHHQGDYTDTVDRGLKWLKQIQDPETGDLHDMRYEQGREAAVFSHSLATIALCEALALTADETLRDPAQRAVNYLLISQHPQDGGWKYRPIFKEANGDMAVTGWALMALHTARMAGIEVAMDDLQRTSGFLDSVQEKYGARYKFEPLNTAQYVTPTLTAEGILCRQWLGWPKDYPPHVDAVQYLLGDSARPQWTAGKRNIYGWFFIAQVLHNRGGDEWRNWYLPTRDLLVKHQVKTGNPKVRGSWHPTQPEGAREEYGEKGGRLYVTAMCLMLLETPTHHAPIYSNE